MKSRRSRLMFAGVMVVAISVTAGLATGGVASAKKKSKSSKVTVTKNLNAAIPDRSAVAPTTFGRLDVTLPVGGKKFKGKVVAADSVVITFQASGTVLDAANDLQFFLASPKGRTILLDPDQGSLGGTSIGPLKLTPNSSAGTCNTATPPCANPFQTLLRPFVGTAGATDLSLFTGIPVSGNWKFTVLDGATTKTSVLNSVKLEITTA